MDLLEPPYFEAAVIGSAERQACSPPAQPFAWRGVVLSTPTAAAGEPGRTRIPVCGFYRFDATREVRSLEGWLEARVDQADPIRVPVSLDDPENEDPAPPEPLTDAELVGRAEGGYFCLDLAQHVALPLRAASVSIRVHLWGAVSDERSLTWSPEAP